MIREKKELSPEEAKEKALQLLEFRSHSEKELRDKLIRVGAKAEDLPPIMEFLREYGFLNDADYARRLAVDLQSLKRFGKRRIREELKMRGIRGEDLENALAELSEDDSEELLEFARKKLGGDFEKKSVDRAIRYFLYRGYEFEDIRAAIDTLKAEAE